MTGTSVDRPSPATTAERGRIRTAAATAAATAGGFTSLVMALLGAPPDAVGPPPHTTVARGSRRYAGRLAGTPLYEWQGPVLGQPAYVGLVGEDPAVLEEMRRRLAELDRRWSTSGRGSELRRLNANPGVALRLSTDTVLLAELATRRLSTVDGTGPPSLWVDVRHGTVGLVADRPVDLAPLAGALAVDLVLSAMVDAGAHGACVRLGPNVRAVGASPHHGGWLAPIEGEAGAPQVLQLQQGAAATVTTRRGSDPGPRMASVVADQAWRAHLLAAAWLRMGTAGVRAMLTDAHAAGRLVRANGSATTAGNWAAFRPTAALC